MVQWYKSGIFFFLIFPLYDNKKSNIFLFLIIKERTKRENTAEKYFTKEKEKYYFRKISIRKRQSKY